MKAVLFSLCFDTVSGVLLKNSMSQASCALADDTANDSYILDDDNGYILDDDVSVSAI